MAILSKGRLSKMMLDILLQFPPGTKNLKENITLRLGMGRGIGDVMLRA